MRYQIRVILLLVATAAFSALLMGLFCFRILRLELEATSIGWAQDVTSLLIQNLKNQKVTLEQIKQDPQFVHNLLRSIHHTDSKENSSSENDFWGSVVVLEPEAEQWRIVQRIDPVGADVKSVGSVVGVRPLQADAPQISLHSRSAGWFQTSTSNWFGAVEPLPDHRGLLFVGARQVVVYGFLLSIIQTVFIAFIIVALVAVAITFPISKRLIKPIQEMSAFTLSLDAGNFGVRLKPSGAFEIQSLYKKLNRLAQNLSDREGLLQRNLQLSGALATQKDRANAINALEMDFTQLSNFDLLMGQVLATVPSILQAQFCGIFLLEDDAFTLSYATHTSESNTVHAVLGHISEQSGIMFDALTNFTTQVSALTPEHGSWVQASGLLGSAAVAIAIVSGTGQTQGVLVVTREPSAVDQIFDDQDISTMRHVSSLISMALERREAAEKILWVMIRMAETRDPSETGSHVKRVSAIALEIFDGWAKRRGMRDEDSQFARGTLRMAAMLHDVGKIGISDLVLKKPGKLTDEEFAIMKRHTVLGAGLLPGNDPHDEAAREVALHHHERWDGRGYPGNVNEQNMSSDIETLLDQPLPSQGIAGDTIPLFARMVAIADVFDALSSKRAYKQAWPAEQVEAEIRKESGKAFDPELIEIFFEHIDRIRAARARYPEHHS